MSKKKHALSLFSYIPDHLLTHILIHLSAEGFEYLGPLLASGKEGMALVFKDEVLKAAFLQTFL